MRPLPRPEWRPKLIVLDLDGTVVAPRVDVPPRPSRAVVDAVATVVGAGVPIIVATGRSVWNCLHTVDDLQLAGIRLVCGNGAVGYDLATQQITHRDTFDPAPAAHALAAALPGASFAVDVDVTGFRTTRDFPRDFPSAFLDPAAPLYELVAAPLMCGF